MLSGLWRVPAALALGLVAVVAFAIGQGVEALQDAGRPRRP